ncbi:MAG: 5-formyltetrahydrofolate cyclo-ligase [Cyanobacteriota bacterium]|nr:5-formyltetrahydrofolate cyclo-ligase [Cyanobacteriota bacterium]
MGPASKQLLRREFRRRRRAAMQTVEAAMAAAARHALPGLISPQQTLGLYWPVGHEPNLLSLAQAQPSGAAPSLALPVVEQRELLYRAWRPHTPLSPDACGIPAPGPASPAVKPGDLGLMLVPALALDHRGIRLGSGGGWYDRLRSRKRWRAVPAVAVLPAACLTPELPSDPWDVPFDGWLDEQGIHWI